jgi:hypothetical protein
MRIGYNQALIVSVRSLEWQDLFAHHATKLD